MIKRMNDPIQVARKGSRLYTGQKQRCGNKSKDCYKYYGSKGIKITYDRETFIYWFLERAKYVNLKDVSVGRIDHSKDYSLDNICLQTKSENSKEMIDRVGKYRYKPVEISLISTGEVIGRYPSISHAARALNWDTSGLSKVCRGISKSAFRKYHAKFVNKEY